MRVFKGLGISRNDLFAFDGFPGVFGAAFSAIQWDRIGVATKEQPNMEFGFTE
jgi:hypothetical protein